MPAPRRVWARYKSLPGVDWSRPARSRLADGGSVAVLRWMTDGRPALIELVESRARIVEVFADLGPALGRYASFPV